MKGEPQSDSRIARYRECAAFNDDVDILLQTRGAAPCARFNRHFYVFKPPRSLEEIDAELKGVTAKIMTMLEGLAE
jgi:hypothetical protein